MCTLYLENYWFRYPHLLICLISLFVCFNELLIRTTI